MQVEDPRTSWYTRLAPKIFPEMHGGEQSHNIPSVSRRNQLEGEGRLVLSQDWAAG